MNPTSKGQRRFVLGTVLEKIAPHQYMVRLDQDDPFDTVGWDKKDNVGLWSTSALKAR